MAALLLLSTIVGPELGWRQALGGSAVMVTFLHAQVSDRLREYAAGDISSPECAHLERAYYIGKEVLWLVYFLSLGAYAPIIGTMGFLLYPKWRAYHRRK